MVGLLEVPTEVFGLIIEQLVVTVGIQKAVLLRTVNHDFDAAILNAICVSQVVDVDDPDTPDVAERMNPVLRGKIIAVKSRSAAALDNVESYVAVVARVNQALDSLIGEEDMESRRRRHESIAGQVLLVNSCSPPQETRLFHPEFDWVDTYVDGQNLLSGAVITGNMRVIKQLLAQQEELSGGLAGVHGKTPYFHSLLTLAASWGHLDVVRHLLGCGARIISGIWPCQAEIIFREHSEPIPGQPIDRDDESEMHYKLPSALRAAILGGHDDVVHLLLRPEHRLEPLTSREYLRAILASVDVGRLDFVDILFRTINKSINKCYSEFPHVFGEMISRASSRGDIEATRTFLAANEDVSGDLKDYHERYYMNEYALRAAERRGDIEMVRWLLEIGAKPNDSWNQPAAECGHEDVLKLLLDHGADPLVAVRSAAEDGQPRVIKYLLDRFPGLLDDAKEGRRVFELALHTKT